jgi:endonuclease YncB( thermonuclease family)
MGRIEIKGNIDLRQFWPDGKSDADTTKILIKVNEDAFSYYASKDDHNPKKTKVFIESKVKPATGKSVNPVKYAGTPRQYITIRLEGIDAPELHYKFYDPATLAKYRGTALFKKYNIEYRQCYSEIATEALSKMLKQYKNKANLVPCLFVSNNINKPSDACDVYGRFVGYIHVNDGKLNVNEWLLKEGLVFPAFYDSAEEDELKKLLKDFKSAKSKPATVVANFSAKLLAFDFKLIFRKNGPSDPSKDAGKLILPKLYRRNCCYSILSKADLCHTSFDDYLKSKKDDKLILYSDFRNYLKSNKKSSFRGILHITDIYHGGTLTADPDSFVFIEKGSILIDPTTKKERLKF